VSVRRVQLQKSAGSILASNKLLRSAPKRVAVGVNRGLAGAASGTQVSGTTSANRSWRSAFIQVKGEGPAKAQDDVRASSSGRRMNAERRCGGRGTGAIRATGSYEGSLSVEGISGCHEPSPFTRRWSRRPWRLPHAGKRQCCAQGQQKLKDREGAPTFRGRGRGDRDVRGSIGSRRRGKTTPTLIHRARREAARETRQQEGSACLATIRRSVPECREALGPPVIRTEPKTLWGVHAVKVA